MKIGIISKPNKKGQFVIPQKIREQFGIDENSSLNIIVKERRIKKRKSKKEIRIKSF